eukprot:jgi/Bigna1/69512/fgenesh1_pg.9_\
MAWLHSFTGTCVCVCAFSAVLSAVSGVISPIDWFSQKTTAHAVQSTCTASLRGQCGFQAKRMPWGGMRGEIESPWIWQRVSVAVTASLVICALIHQGGTTQSVVAGYHPAQTRLAAYHPKPAAFDSSAWYHSSFSWRSSLGTHTRASSASSLSRERKPKRSATRIWGSTNPEDEEDEGLQYFLSQTEGRPRGDGKKNKATVYGGSSSSIDHDHVDSSSSSTSSTGGEQDPEEGVDIKIADSGDVHRSRIAEGWAKNTTDPAADNDFIDDYASAEAAFESAFNASIASSSKETSEDGGDDEDNRASLEKILNDLEVVQLDTLEDTNEGWWESAHATGKYDDTEFVATYWDIRSTLHLVMGLDYQDDIAKQNLSVLDVGCGGSHVAEDLFLDGFRDITGIDVSEAAIETVKKRLSSPDYVSHELSYNDLGLQSNSLEDFLRSSSEEEEEEEGEGEEEKKDHDSHQNLQQQIEEEQRHEEEKLPPELARLPERVFFSAEGTEGAAKFPPHNVIESAMTKRWKIGKNLAGFSGKFMAVDARQLDQTFGEGSFDLIIDKGTLESIAVGNAFRDVHRMLASISRVLKPGGMFLSISFALPEQRTPLLSGPLPQLRGVYEWSVYPQGMVTPDGTQFTVYVCRKKKKKKAAGKK